MPLMPRIVVKNDPAVYHVMSRVALDGYPLGDVEKEYLLETIRHLSSVYFAEVLGFCLMLDSCSAGGHMLLAKKHYSPVPFPPFFSCYAEASSVYKK